MYTAVKVEIAFMEIWKGKKNLNNDVIQCAVGKSAYFKYMNIKIKNAINKATDFLVIEQLTFK